MMPFFGENELFVLKNFQVFRLSRTDPKKSIYLLYFLIFFRLAINYLKNLRQKHIIAVKKDNKNMSSYAIARIAKLKKSQLQ